MPPLSADAPAKLNLTLRVLRRRDDGFHELDSVVACVALADTVTVSLRGDDALTVVCDDPAVPTDGRNLVLKAAATLRDACAVRRGVHIGLVKRIPAGAGLGGGSSDAAATLRLLNHLWGLGMPEQQLAQVAARVGSDVPLFLAGSLCRVRGRGEHVEPLPLRLAGHVVLVLPPIHAATRDVFAAWRPVPRVDDEPNPARLLAGGWAQVMPRLFNDLEQAAERAVGELATFAGALRAKVDACFRMTGSGSAYFAVYDELSQARAVAAQAAEALQVRTEVVGFA